MGHPALKGLSFPYILPRAVETEAEEILGGVKVGKKVPTPTSA
jgi:hypothetical protein